MLMASHTLIGKTISETLSGNLNIRLDESGFKYGCIKPDIVPRLRAIPHYMDCSMDFLIESMETLYNGALITSPGALKTFSIELGVVTHYVADYFCFAHNHHRYSFIPLHMIYENKLAQELAKTDLKTLCGKFLYTAEALEICDRNDWRNYLVKNYRDYLYSRECIGDDIRYTMKTCTAIAYLIASRCLEKEAQAVA